MNKKFQCFQFSYHCETRFGIEKVPTTKTGRGKMVVEEIRWALDKVGRDAQEKML